MGPPDTHVVDLDLVTSLRLVRARFWSEGGLNSQFGGLLLRDDSNCSQKSTRNPAEDLHFMRLLWLWGEKCQQFARLPRNIRDTRMGISTCSASRDHRHVNVGGLSAKTNSCIVFTRIQTLFPPSASASTVASISIVPPSTTMVSALPFILNLGY